MARWADPRDTRLVIIMCRSLKDWNQAELCLEAGIDPATMSRYESGEQTPFPKNLARIAEAVGVGWDFVEELIPLCRSIRLAYERSLARKDFAEDDRDELDRKLVGAALHAAAPFLRELAEAAACAPRASDREWAATLWEGMKDLPAAKQQLIVDMLDDHRIWALAERLGQASADAASHRADKALELAKLALRAAGRIPEGSWRSLNEGFAWAVCGNARRVGGNLPAAREAIRTADQRWAAGEGGDPSGLLDGSILLEIKAILYRYDGKIEEALALLDQARSAARSETARARILLITANTFELAGEYQRALDALQQAEPHIEARGEPRTRFLLLFGRASNLLHLERPAQAQDLLPQVRQLAVELGNQLELTRVLWLAARIGAGFGRLVEAREAFEQVRHVFEEQRIAYDYALASLELAVVHLDQGHTAEVAKLAEEMWWIFKSQEVHKEALAALGLFCEAARKGQADAGWVRRMITFLNRAQYNPNLRFEL